MSTDMDYDDGLIATTADAVIIRRYTLLLAPRIIPYEEIRAIERISLTRWGGGRGRLWGGSPPSRWYNLDFGRPRKRVGFLIDDGDPIRPVITPDDPQAFAASMRAHGIGGV